MGLAQAEWRASRKSQRETLRALTWVRSELSAGGIETEYIEQVTVHTANDAHEVRACIYSAKNHIGDMWCERRNQEAESLE
jgi:hypothetical protein